MKIEINNCYNIDCKIGMQLMKEQEIKADWCITDVPYGISIEKMSFTKSGAIKTKNAKAKRNDYTATGKWDSERISVEFFDLMKQCSNEQIIFGGNYYTDILPPSKSWVIWDKRLPNESDRNDFAHCEMAWCSTGQARVFHYLYNGMLQGDMIKKDYRFHPTQKPTQLWTKLLNFYTKEGDLILDPFAGSQSLRISCHKMNRKYIGFEIDEEYFRKGTEWYNSVAAQISIFDYLL